MEPLAHVKPQLSSKDVDTKRKRFLEAEPAKDYEEITPIDSASRNGADSQILRVSSSNEDESPFEGILLTLSEDEIEGESRMLGDKKEAHDLVKVIAHSDHILQSKTSTKDENESPALKTILDPDEPVEETKNPHTIPELGVEDTTAALYTALPVSSLRRRCRISWKLKIRKAYLPDPWLENGVHGSDEDTDVSTVTTISEDNGEATTSPIGKCGNTKSKLTLGSPISDWVRGLRGSSESQSPYLLTERQYLDGDSLGSPPVQSKHANSPKSVLVRDPSYGSFPSYGGEWTPDELLQHTNEVRIFLSDCTKIPKEIAAASLILTRLLGDEEDAVQKIDLNTIAYTRLDILLQTLINTEKHMSTTALSEKALTTAKTLMSRWQERFGERYFDIDDLRLAQMRDTGGFHDVILNHFGTNARDMFIVKGYKPGTMYSQGAQAFKAGDWWLNLSCAYRDGVTASPIEYLNCDHRGVLTLALMNGTEVRGENDRTYTYNGSGRNKDMPTLLIKCNKGRPLRLLRGFGLQSFMAPKGGVRFDGMHRVKVFGHKYHGDGKWTWRIVLEQSEDEPLETQLREIPLPSQMDEWHLCNQMIDNDKCTRVEELSRAEEIINEQGRIEYDGKLTKLRASIEEAFRAHQDVSS